MNFQSSKPVLLTSIFIHLLSYEISSSILLTMSFSLHSNLFIINFYLILTFSINFSFIII